jgi:hypothetical protein
VQTPCHQVSIAHVLIASISREYISFLLPVGSDQPKVYLPQPLSLCPKWLIAALEAVSIVTN